MLLSLKFPPTPPPTGCRSLTQKYSLATTVTQTGCRVLPGSEEDIDLGSFIGSEDSLVCPRGLFGLVFPEVLSLPPLTHLHFLHSHSRALSLGSSHQGKNSILSKYSVSGSEYMEPGYLEPADCMLWMPRMKPQSWTFCPHQSGTGWRLPAASCVLG